MLAHTLSSAAPFADGDFATLTIDLGAVATNYRIIKHKIGPHVQIAPAVKTNAYGLGMNAVVRALHAAGARHFFVATGEEALTLRDAIPDAAIYVLGCGLPAYGDDYIARDITPVLNSPHDIALWRDMARTRGRKLPAVLHFNTGMNRLGLTGAEAAALHNAPDALDSFNIAMVMSHFACADERDHPLNRRQFERFQDIAARFPGTKKSLCNSSGIFLDTAYHFDIVRPGMALLGLNPMPGTENPMNPVVTLSARILQIHTAKKGESAGYGATHIFDRDTNLAVLGIGYGDGFFRSHGNRARVFWCGHPCPVVGRVSMDLVTVDIGGLPNNITPPNPGDMMELIGPHQSADQLAAAAGTIGYEILTNLGPRLRRDYVTK